MHVPKGATEVSTKYGALHVVAEMANQFTAVTADDLPLTIFGIEYQLRIHVEWKPKMGCREAGWHVEHSWSERMDIEWHHQGKNDLTEGATRIIRHGDLADALIEHVTERAEAGDQWAAELDRIKHKIKCLHEESVKLDAQREALSHAAVDADRKSDGNNPLYRDEYTCKCERYDNGMQKHQHPDVERCVLCCNG